MILLTSRRIRAIIAACHTDIDVMLALRAHRIRYTYTTETGELSIRIPTRKGAVRIVRGSRPGALVINNTSPVPFRPALHSEEV